MVRVLISGYTARSASPSYRRRSGVPQMLENALRHGGHDVQRDHWRADKPLDLSTYDLFLIGLNSPVSVASGHTYSAATLIESLWGDKRLVLFPETPEVWHIKDGNLTAVRDETRLFNDFMSKRPGYQYFASSLRRRTQVRRACALLSSVDWWPVFLVPAFQGADLGTLLRRAPRGAQQRAEMIDLTQCVPELTAEPVDEPLRRWLIETPRVDRGIRSVVTWADKELISAVSDQDLVDNLVNSLGIIETPHWRTKVPGAWSLTPALAAVAGRFFHGHARTYDALGDAFRILPAMFEEADLDWRRKIITWQQESLLRNSQPGNDVLRQLEALTK